MQSATSKSSSTTGYSPVELEKFKEIFRTVPSYEESISAKDLIFFLQKINYVKPVATYEKYMEYSEKILGGRFELTQILKYLGTAHDARLLMNEYLVNFDRNNDGYVSIDEFKYGMETIQVHDPRVKNISYEAFLKEADVDKDGRISVSECKNWLNKYLQAA